MRFEGTLDIAAPRDRVWAFLTDPKQVTTCAPDVQSLDVTGERTTLRWASDVTVNGMIAQVGARLMQGAADKITQQVFSCIQAKLESPASAGISANPA